MIHVKSVSKSFGKQGSIGRQRVLDRVNFSMDEGELVGVIGPSGSGKSVLLKIIGDVLEPDSGEIYRETEVGTPSDEPERRAVSSGGVGFLFQEGALFDSMSVIENVAFPLLSTKTAHGELSYNEVMTRAHEILCEVGLREAYKKYPGQLSGGMRRRVGIARALVSHPRLVLLDDPTGGLDPVAARVIMNLILSLHKQYKPTVVLVSHDIRRLLPSVSRVLGLFDGKLVCDEATETLSTQASKKVIDFLATRYDFENSSNASAS